MLIYILHYLRTVPPTENNGHGPQMEQDMLKWISVILIPILPVVLAVCVILLILWYKRCRTSSAGILIIAFFLSTTSLIHPNLLVATLSSVTC